MQLEKGGCYDLLRKLAHSSSPDLQCSVMSAVACLAAAPYSLPPEHRAFWEDKVGGGGLTPASSGVCVLDMCVLYQHQACREHKVKNRDMNPTHSVGVRVGVCVYQAD